MFLITFVSCCRFVLRVVCCALGIIIEEDESVCNRDKNTRFLVSNHLSILDFVPIHLLTNCQTVSYSKSKSLGKISVGLGFNFSLISISAGLL